MTPTRPTTRCPSGDALIGDEVEVESFTETPFDHMVRFEPLSLFGPAGPHTATP